MECLYCLEFYEQSDVQYRPEVTPASCAHHPRRSSNKPRTVQRMELTSCASCSPQVADQARIISAYRSPRPRTHRGSTVHDAYLIYLAQRPIHRRSSSHRDERRPMFFFRVIYWFSHVKKIWRMLNLNGLNVSGEPVVGSWPGIGAGSRWGNEIHAYQAGISILSPLKCAQIFHRYDFPIISMWYKTLHKVIPRKHSPKTL